MLLLPILALPPVQLPAAQTYACSDVRLRTFEGQPGPEGGQIAADALPLGATLGDGGKIAFIARIAGLARNQAVLVSDGQSLRAVAVGCGEAGGEGNPGSCGDPTPIGGTFSGFFLEPWFAPSINAAGDVLFLSDVHGGGTSRALFLYREATGALETVVAVGQLSPSGSPILGLGSASLDAQGGVLFLARTDPSSGPANEILANDDGVLTLLAGDGGNGPDGPYDLVSGEFQLCHDGTSIAVGPMPARDETGRVAHFASTTTFQNFGLVLKEPGQPPVWIASYHQPTPAGGTFERFYGPIFAPNGDVFFSAQYKFGNNTRAGWFAGTPGSLRKVIASFDSVGPLTCANFDRSRSQLSSIGRAGEVVLWSIVQRADQSFGEAHVLVRANGSKEVLAETGGAAPGGGVIVELGRSPTIDRSGRVLQSARIDQGPTTNATWLRVPCGTPVTFCDGKPSSLGCEPRIGSVGRGSASGAALFLVNGDSLPSRRTAILYYGPGMASTPYQGGLLCAAQPMRRTPAQTSTGPSPSDCSGSLEFDFGARIASGIDPTLVVGSSFAAQWLVRDPADPQGFGTSLSDAILFTIGP